MSPRREMAPSEGRERDGKPFAQRESSNVNELSASFAARLSGSGPGQESRHFAVANEFDKRLQVIRGRFAEDGKGDYVTHLLV